MAVEKYQVERILAALRALTTNGYIKKEWFMDECRISPRTFDRFIADLRLYIPVRYDDSKKYYEVDRTRKTERSDMLEQYKKLMIKDDFLLFYAFVRSMLKSRYFFPPFSTDDGTSSRPKDFEKVLDILKDLVEPVDRTVYDKVEYYVSGHYHLRRRPHYRAVMESILNSFKTEVVLGFRYFRSALTVQPLKLVYYNGKWYLIAWLISSTRPSEECGQVRMYKLAHIKSPKISHGEYFPLSEEPEYSFTESFGLYMDEDVKEAVVNLYGTAASDAPEIVWHKDQRTENFTDAKGKTCARIRLKYPEHGSVELVSRVLSFGTNAEIISPPDLRKQWQKKIKEMSAKFLKK
ncbi:MAG: helix-turn-helix transcriptional regulator [Candidatus Delongbacteria bacterium]